MQRRELLDHQVGLVGGDPHHLIADVVARREVLHHDHEPAVVAHLREVADGRAHGAVRPDVLEEGDLTAIDAQREGHLEVGRLGAGQLDHHPLRARPGAVAEIEAGDLAEDAGALADVGHRHRIDHRVGIDGARRRQYLGDPLRRHVGGRGRDVDAHDVSSKMTPALRSAAMRSAS
jgi:hypothetical protein